MYFAGVALILIPFCIYSLTTYQTLLPPYYTHQDISSSRFFEALVGHLFSLARGLLVYSSIRVLAFVGIGLKVRNKTLGGIDIAVIVIICLHWIAISLFLDWAGGVGYGSRYFSDVVPYFIFFTIPAVECLIQKRRLALKSIVAMLLIVSVYIHWYGATYQETVNFIAYPDWYTRSPSPLWSTEGMPFLNQK